MLACLPATGDRSGEQGTERREFEALDAVEDIPGVRAALPVASDPDIAASVEHGPHLCLEVDPIRAIRRAGLQTAGGLPTTNRQ
jgi:hypothetical protein